MHHSVRRVTHRSERNMRTYQITTSSRTASIGARITFCAGCWAMTPCFRARIARSRRPGATKRLDTYTQNLSSVSKCRQLDLLVAPTRANGSKRTRTRAGSNVTMLPFSKASTSWGRFASSVRASASGFRLPSPRNWMTDGWRDERTASNVPKSQSADTTIRCSAAARSKITSSSACCNPIERTWSAS